MPHILYAAASSYICPQNFTCAGSSPASSLGDFSQKIITIADWVVAITMVITFVILICGFFLYSSSETSVEGRDQAQSIITNSIIGLAIILIGYMLIWFAVQLLSGSLRIS